MTTVADPPAIFDRRAQMARLDQAVAKARPGDVRAAVLDALGCALGPGRAEIRRRFEAGTSGAETVAAGAYLIDQLVHILYDTAFESAYPLANPTAGERLTVIATGGYGRTELAPQSDIDLLFVFPYKATAHTEQAVEYILYALWDLGLKVGHATRSVNDCVRLAVADHTIRTGILEARYVCGDHQLFNLVHRRFWAEVVEGTLVEFVQAKLAERDARHRRMGGSRYVMEPNAKDGKGGLRDLHTLFWIARYLYRVDRIDELVGHGVLTAREAKSFAKARNLLLTLRCHLHYVTGRPGDVLTFDVQPEIARRMRYKDHAVSRAVERLMKHYFLTAKTVGGLTRIFCAAFAIEHGRRRRTRPLDTARADGAFALEGRWLAISDEVRFADDPINLLRLFHIAHERDLDIHPSALKLVTRSLRLIGRELRAEPEANRLFLEMLSAPEGAEASLRRLNEAGVLGLFIPEFGRVVAQTQHDMYHAYTVDEHIMRAIGILGAIEQGHLAEDHPLASEIVHKVISRRVLSVALLLHDIGKGRGGRHWEIGAGIARTLGPRLGLSEEETDQVAWLVLNHMHMSEVAFKRDLGEAKTIADFAAFVQSPERLRLLLVITVCDIRAVGPKVWNNWKAALLRELYYRAEEVMLSGLSTAPAEARVEHVHAALRRALADWSEDALEAHFARLQPSYWLAHDAALLVRHARLVGAAAEPDAPLGIDIEVDRTRAITTVAVSTADRPGLFARLAGAVAVAGADIVDARIFTTTDGRALDTFFIQEPGAMAAQRDAAFAGPLKIARLRRCIGEAVRDELDVAAGLAGRRVLPTRAGVFEVPPRVLIDDRVSATHTVIEVNGRDRWGLLHALTRALSDLDLQISSAKISTYGEQVVDVFYVKDAYGVKVSHPDRLDAIRARLAAVFADDAPPARASAAE